MLEGYIDFFMDPSLAECYVKLKEELDKLLQKKVSFDYIKKEHARLYVSYMCITEHRVMYSHVMEHYIPYSSHSIRIAGTVFF